MAKNVPKATHQGVLNLSGFEIPCFVLEDETRLISQRGLQKSIGMSISGGQKPGVRRIEEFLINIFGSGIEINELIVRINNPIFFRPSHGGRTAFGYEATILADICDIMIGARKDNKLQTKFQFRIAERCEMLMRAFAKVGIIALVDAATNYEEIRDKKALQKILDKFLLVDQAKWAKRFPDEFYELMFKLRGWQWKGMKVNRPSIVGKYTNDLVYERLAPGLLVELNRLNPPSEEGRRKSKHQQWLTEDVGHPALQRHLYMLIGFERASANWGMFYRMVQRALPKLNEQIPLALEE